MKFYSNYLNSVKGILALLVLLLFPFETILAAPVNDDPCSATTLTVNTSCSFSTYSNTSATASAGIPSAGCGTYTTGDVWFQVTVPANGVLMVNTQAGTLTDATMAWYTGTVKPSR